MSKPETVVIPKRDMARRVTVRRPYGKNTIEHLVTENCEDAEIKIEMALEPFIAAVLERIGHPALIITRARLRRKVSEAINAEILRMKESTVYKAVETPQPPPDLSRPLNVY